jgi:AraC-like DNA-binding protein
MLWAPGYREWSPPPELRGAVACLWVRVTPAAGTPSALVLPDGCVDLMWREDGGAFVAGPDTGPQASPPQPGSIIVGARFRPGAGGAALGVPLSEIRNQRVDLVDLRRELARRLGPSLAPDEALERVGRAAAELVAAGPPDALVVHGARLLNRPGTSVESVVRELDVSERQLRRRFQTAVGYGPKTLHGVLRFRRFLDRIDTQRFDGPALDGPDHGGGLAGLALDAGYADQAHLTRESTRLAGLPPAALARTRAAG